MPQSSATPRATRKTIFEMTPGKFTPISTRCVSPKRPRESTDSPTSARQTPKRTKSLVSSSLDSGLLRLLGSQPGFLTPVRARRCLTPPAPRKIQQRNVDEDFILEPKSLFLDQKLDLQAVVELQVISNFIQSYAIIKNCEFFPLEDCLSYVATKSRNMKSKSVLNLRVKQLVLKCNDFVTLHAELLFVRPQQTKTTLRLLRTLI